MDFRKIIIERLKPYNGYFYGDELAALLVIRSLPSEQATEQPNEQPHDQSRPSLTDAKSAFAGNYGLALDKSFARLDWGYGSNDTRVWMGVAINPPNMKAMDAQELLAFAEIIDPLVIIALDEASRSLLTLAYKGIDPNIDAELESGKFAVVLGRKLVSVDGFEQALSDETHKKRLWGQLKQAAFPKPLTKTKF